MIVRYSQKLGERQVLHLDYDDAREAFAAEIDQRGYHVSPAFAEALRVPLGDAELAGLPPVIREGVRQLTDPKLVACIQREIQDCGLSGFDAEVGAALVALGADVADNDPMPSECRVRLLRGGFDPLPLIGKRPFVNDWQKRGPTSAGDIEIWSKVYPNATNTGMLCRTTPTIDLDIMNPEAADAVEQLIRDRYESDGGYVLVRFGKAPKRAIPFRTDEPFKKITANLIAPSGGSEKVEFLCDGQQVVVAGTHPDTGLPYRWHGGEPGQIKRADLPYIQAAEARELVEQVVALLVAEHGYQRTAQRPEGNGADADPRGRDDWRHLIANIIAGHQLHDSLRDLGAKMLGAGTNPGAVVNHLRALMETSTAPHDARWQERHDDIPRLVNGAKSFRDRTGPNGSGGAQTLGLSLEYYNDLTDITPPKPWLIKNLLARGETSNWFGPPRVGKSVLLTDLAFHVAAGLDWHGLRSKEQCGVVYIALERGALIKRRLGAYKRRYGVVELPIAVASNIIDLKNPSCVKLIVDTIRSAGARFGCPVGLVVIDTISKGVAAGGGDEDKAKDVNAVAANLRRVEQLTKVHIACVGHTGKDATRGHRGSNAHDGDNDMMVQISGDEGVKTATIVKINDGHEGPLTHYKIESYKLGEDEDGDEITVGMISQDQVAAEAEVKTRKGLSPLEQRALDLLTRCINDEGMAAPPSPKYPPSTRVVSLKAWRTACERGGLSSSEERTDRTKAFRRAKDGLQTKMRIASPDEWVWLVRDG